LLALAILFYFTGMAMESTTIPLELYFEHRNYLPALPMFWPLAWWLSDLRRLRGFKATLTLALPVLLALLTLQRATLWGHADQQAMLWAQINPHSARAQAYAAQFEAGNGQPVDAQRRLLPLLAAHPDQVQLAFNLLNVQCQLGGVTAAAAQSARTAMATMRNPGTLLTSWFGRALGVAQAAHCPGLMCRCCKAWWMPAWATRGCAAIRGASRISITSMARSRWRAAPPPRRRAISSVHWASTCAPASPPRPPRNWARRVIRAARWRCSIATSKSPRKRLRPASAWA